MLGKKHFEFLVKGYLVGDFSARWAHKVDKNDTISCYRCRHVLALFNVSFNKNIGLKECMISSIDSARKGTIGFSVWYATRNLVSTFVVLAKNLNLTNIRESVIAAFRHFWVYPISQSFLISPSKRPLVEEF